MWGIARQKLEAGGFPVPILEQSLQRIKQPAVSTLRCYSSATKEFICKDVEDCKAKTWSWRISCSDFRTILAEDTTACSIRVEMLFICYQRGVVFQSQSEFCKVSIKHFWYCCSWQAIFLTMKKITVLRSTITNLQPKVGSILLTLFSVEFLLWCVVWLCNDQLLQLLLLIDLSWINT
ncbi:unnamed protein product [Camellia sinensis]